LPKRRESKNHKATGAPPHGGAFVRYLQVMNEKPQDKKLPKLRTFAQDLLFVREHKSGIDPAAIATSPLPKVVAKEIVINASKVTPKSAVVTSNFTKPLGHLSSKNSTPAPAGPTPVTSMGGATTLGKAPTLHSSSLDEEGATIITDTKRKSFKLVPAIIESVKNWYKKRQRAIAQKKIPKYSVADTSLRKGVIQKATSKTAKSNTADFASIQERIQMRKEREKTELTTSWSGNTEPGFLLLESPIVEEAPAELEIIHTSEPLIKNVQVIKRSQPALEAILATAPKADIIEEGPSGFDDPQYQVSEEVDVIVPSTTFETPVLAAVEVAPSEPVTATAISPEEDIKSVTKIPVNIVKEIKPFRLNLVDTNHLTVLVSAISALVIITGTVIILYPKGDQTTSLEQIAPKNILNNSVVTSLTITGPQSINITTALTTAREDISRLTELSLISNGVSSSPTLVFNHLYKNANLSFVKSTKVIHFGYSSERVPFVVFTYTDKVAIYGGMLAWEDSLGEDFSNIFGLGVSVADSSFVDEQINGVDVRIKTNEDGSDYVVYGLVGTTVIITKDRLTFAALIPLVN
jgi:hypothetical protein